MKTKLKDVILIIAILIVAISGFYMFSQVFKKTTYNMALVSQNKEIVVKVDFLNEEIIINKWEDRYPIVDEINQTITLLGNYQNGVRYEFVIKYNFKKHSMQVIEEESPKNISSKIGEKTASSIISIPNGITITFSNDGEVNLDDII